MRRRGAKKPPTAPREHAAARLFPLLGDEELDELAADIKEHGLREPILLTRDGQILDGRNRLRACRKAGVTPRFRTWDGEGSPVDVVLSANLHRRHLSESQRACVAAQALPLFEATARERQLAQLKKGTAAPVPQKVAERAGEAREQAAAAFRTNRQYVSDAKKLKAADPKAFAAVLAGEKTLQEAKRERQAKAKEKERECWRQLDRRWAAEDDVSTVVARLEDVLARYRCVLLDPPWRYADAGCEGAAEAVYETMPLDDIEALPVGALVHPEGGHVWMWITWPMMREGAHLHLFAAWGLTWKSELVWHKLGGMGLGRWLRSESEVLLLGVKGACPRLANDVRGFIETPRGRHSEKPVQAYDLLEAFSPGPRIELFARRARTGWDRWGNEAGPTNRVEGSAPMATCPSGGAG